MTVITNVGSFNLPIPLSSFSSSARHLKHIGPGWLLKATQDRGNKPVYGRAHNGENSEARLCQGWCAKERNLLIAVVHTAPRYLLSVKWSCKRCPGLEDIFIPRVLVLLGSAFPLNWTYVCRHRASRSMTYSTKCRVWMSHEIPPVTHLFFMCFYQIRMMKTSFSHVSV